MVRVLVNEDDLNDHAAMQRDERGEICCTERHGLIGGKHRMGYNGKSARLLHPSFMSSALVLLRQLS
eukprot:COSAG02_NODE_23596_length_713_cov_4.081433_1_plen_67_part_00